MDPNGLMRFLSIDGKISHGRFHRLLAGVLCMVLYASGRMDFLWFAGLAGAMDTWIRLDEGRRTGIPDEVRAIFLGMKEETAYQTTRFAISSAVYLAVFSTVAILSTQFSFLWPFVPAIAVFCLARRAMFVLLVAIPVSRDWVTRIARWEEKRAIEAKASIAQQASVPNSRFRS